MNVLSLCAGVGGLDLGTRLAVPTARTVCYVEREAYSAAVLAARMEDGTLDAAPVVLDLSEFCGSPWRDVVNCVIAGFPCQPFSFAGKGLGEADERWLWDDVARVVREVEPGLVFLENVPGLVRRGLARVVGDLAELGFDAEWSVFSAAAVGAPHIRKRLFLLARHPDRRRESAGAVDAKASRVPSDSANADCVELWGESRRGIGPRRADAAEFGDDWWTAEPDVGRVADGVAHRVDRLRACGNGVVPAVAARAWCELTRRLDE